MMNKTNIQTFHSQLQRNQSDAWLDTLQQLTRVPKLDKLAAQLIADAVQWTSWW